MEAAADKRDSRQDLLREVWLPGLVLTTLAILVRILAATWREGIEIDGITYLQNATALWGDWKRFNALHPPLFSLALAPLSGLWSDPEWAARVFSAVCGGLWVWPTLWLARETTDEPVSWTAGLLVALMPAGVEAGTRVLPEALFGLCLTLCLVALVRTLRTGAWAPTILVGLLGGLATLARPEGMGYLVLSVSLLLLAPALGEAHWTGRRVLTRILAIILLWVAVLSPYLIAIRRQTGHWHWSGKVGITLRWAESVGADQPGVVVERTITEAGTDEVPSGILAYGLTHPGATVRRVVINLHLMDKYTLPGLLQSAGIALVFLGVLHLRWRRPPSPPEWFLAVVPLPAAGFLLFVVESRYFVPLIPVLSIIAGVGLARLGRREESAPSRRSFVLGTLVLAAALLSFIPWIVRPWFRQDPAAVEKAAGLWLRRSHGPGATFLGRYPVVAYYAGAQGIPFARRSLDDLVAEGRKGGARYLVADNVRLPESRPDLLALAAGQPGRPDLELAHVVEDRAGRRVAIYRLR
jgi:4-amino-4-deoxy-L-arabinose transferase-like glycosyltransferase